MSESTRELGAHPQLNPLMRSSQFVTLDGDYVSQASINLEEEALNIQRNDIIHQNRERELKEACDPQRSIINPQQAPLGKELNDSLVAAIEAEVSKSKPRSKKPTSDEIAIFKMQRELEVWSIHLISRKRQMI